MTIFIASLLFQMVVTKSELVEAMGDDAYIVRQWAYNTLKEQSNWPMLEIRIGTLHKDLEIANRCELLIVEYSKLSFEPPPANVLDNWWLDTWVDPSEENYRRRLIWHRWWQKLFVKPYLQQHTDISMEDVSRLIAYQFIRLGVPKSFIIYWYKWERGVKGYNEGEANARYAKSEW